MNRDKIYKEIKETFGFVPTFMKSLSDRTLELDWEMFKKVQLEDTNIPHKYRELIGLGIHAVTKCRFCTLYHAEMAKLYGATDEEIEETVHYAKESAGWSAYINGMQDDYDVFRDELKRAVKYAKAKTEKKAA